MKPLASQTAIPQVVFCGVDGAGKSTQIERLAAHLRQAGWVPAIFWSRIGYTPGMQGAKDLLRWLLGRRAIPSGESAGRSAVLHRPWIRRWWIRLAILDLLWRFTVVARWHTWQGHPVIFDRYLDDSRIDIQVHFTHEDVTKYWLWKLLAWLAPKPTAEFLLLVPLDIYLERSEAKNEPFPMTAERFAVRYQLYAAEATNPKWHVLDGQLPINVLAREILDVVLPNQNSNSAVSPRT
jgi:thymidylate kinase